MKINVEKKLRICEKSFKAIRLETVNILSITYLYVVN